MVNDYMLKVKHMRRVRVTVESVVVLVENIDVFKPNHVILSFVIMKSVKTDSYWIAEQ